MAEGVNFQFDATMSMLELDAAALGGGTKIAASAITVHITGRRNFMTLRLATGSEASVKF